MSGFSDNRDQKEQEQPEPAAAREYKPSSDGADTGAYPASAYSPASHAERVLTDAESALASLVKVLRAGGDSDLAAVEAAAGGIMEVAETLDRQLLWVQRTWHSDSAFLRRAIGCGCLAAVICERLMLPPGQKTSVITGAMLMDIGKIRMPVPLLAKQSFLSSEEQRFIRSHVEAGLEALGGSDSVPAVVSEMILGHHERFDGSGYPDGLAGLDIPLFARLGGLIDSYDAMLADRAYATALSMTAALAVINADRGLKYDEVLVSRFLDVLGAYPLGSWVRLQTGETGVVCEQVEREPLRPRIAIVADVLGERAEEVFWIRPHSGNRIERALAPAELPEDWRAVELALQALMQNPVADDG